MKYKIDKYPQNIQHHNVMEMNNHPKIRWNTETFQVVLKPIAENIIRRKIVPKGEDTLGDKK